jgi:hypothetical protein
VAGGHRVTLPHSRWVPVTPGGVTATAAGPTGTTLRPPGHDGQRARIAPFLVRTPPDARRTVPVTPPKHPLPALTSYELRDYRRLLERAIEGISPGAPVQAALRAKLDAVLAEQDDRARMAAGA